jgi:phosphoribosylamine--glycine ligase
MRILVIGSGGREHALVWKISQSRHVTKLFCAPGNPGIQSLAECVPLKPTDLAGMLAFAERERIDLTVVGPEQPLADGIVDLFASRNLPIFGPSKRAAELEWSKAFAKEFMRRHGVPTAEHRSFSKDESDAAFEYVATCSLPVVLKADGLAAGKGVVICESREEAVNELKKMMVGEVFGSAGDTVVIEEFLEGEEASVFAVCDGIDYITLAPAQDHKRALDEDRGKNTGGMGAYAPAPVITDEVLLSVKKGIIEPTLGGMMAEGRPFRGCLYCGLMITPDGPKVVEYNCRFGDPETQVVLPLYDGDVVELLSAACSGSLSSFASSPSNSGGAVCVVLASKGYPEEYEVGKPIVGLEHLAQTTDVLVFHAGTKWSDNRIVTAGGRVLGITAWEKTASLLLAIEKAYRAVQSVSFEGMHFRTDIGKKALATYRLAVERSFPSMGHARE